MHYSNHLTERVAPSQSTMLKHPVLRGELAHLLSRHPLIESLRSLRLIVLDHQLQQLLAGENSEETDQLVECLSLAIQLATKVDSKKYS